MRHIISIMLENEPYTRIKTGLEELNDLAPDKILDQFKFSNLPDMTSLKPDHLVKLIFFFDQRLVA